MKKLFKIIRYPLSIILGGYTYYWLVTNPLESYTMPVIIIWLPDAIGWNAFFILVGIFVCIVSFTICSYFAGSKWAEDL